MLSGTRVLDLTDESGWLAGKILGDLGADVIKVEPSEGDPGRRRGPFLENREDPERCLRWLALNTSKRGVALDLTNDADRASFFELLATADAVLESGPPGRLDELGLGWDVLHARHSDLVLCSLSPFGQTGPRAHYRAHDLVLVALGGNAANTGDPDRAPLRCTLPTSYLHAAPEAALGVLMGLLARNDGAGGQHMDVSLHECQLQTLLSFPGQVALGAPLTRRAGARTGRTREIWRASDGWISFGLRGGPARIPNLIATVELMAERDLSPDWLRDYDWSSYDHATVSDEDISRIEAAFGEFFSRYTMLELYEEALARRILLAPCNDAAEILKHAQLRDRELFTRIEYPELGAAIEQVDFFARTDDRAVRIRRRAPRIGEHQHEVLGALKPRAASKVSESPGRVFEGLRILELGSGAAGPVAARYFAEQGAEVIRVESAKRPDFLRLYHPPDSPHGLDGAPMFVLLNPNKKSIAINMTRTDGVELVHELIDWADVVAENFSPGVMEKWGLAPARLLEQNPRLIVVSNCLFGQTGPQRSYPGFGGQGSAISGFNHITGWPDREAVGPYATITDSLSPRYVAAVVAAALLEKKATGRGRHIDVSQIEAGVYSLSELAVRYSANGEVVTRDGNREPGAAPHGIYPCAGEDRWIAISVFDDDAWRALAGAMGDPDWTRDALFASAEARCQNQDALDEALSGWTRGADRYELMEQLQSAGVEAGVVQNHDDLLEDPQLVARKHWKTLHHLHLGDLRFEHSGIRMSNSPRRLEHPGPNLGEHTERVLRDVLGMGPDEIRELDDAGVLV